MSVGEADAQVERDRPGQQEADDGKSRSTEQVAGDQASPLPPPAAPDGRERQYRL
jgi:hypothetical protein